MQEFFYAYLTPASTAAAMEAATTGVERAAATGTEAAARASTAHAAKTSAAAAETTAPRGPGASGATRATGAIETTQIGRAHV